jgi:hypothetical protein
MSPYNAPAVSAGEIADYLDQLRLEVTPLPQPRVSAIRSVSITDEYAYGNYPAASDNNQQHD